MKKKSTPKSILLRDKAEELTEKSVIKNIIETAKAGTNEASLTKLHYIDSNIIGLFTALFEGKIIEINDYFLNILGFSRADFEESLIDWLALTPPEWSKADEVAQHELHEKGKCSPYEKEFICKNGSRIDVLITGELLPGPEEHIAAFVLDITERKKMKRH